MDAARLINRFARSALARLHMRRCQKAASLIQRWWRSTACRLNLYGRQMVAATRIQSFMRGYWSRLQTQRLDSASRSLAFLYRRQVATQALQMVRANKLQEELRNQCDAATSQKAVQLAAVVRIQGLFRGRRLRMQRGMCVV